MRVSQLALHTSKAILCARLQAVALHFSRKTFRHLAPPNLALARLHSLTITLIRCQLLHSVASSPNAYAKQEECSSYDPGLCYSTPFGTCSYVKKGDIPCTSNPKVLCQRIVPPRSMVFYTLDVCTTEPCYSPELGWTEYSPPFQAHIKWRNRQQPHATMPPLQQLQDFHPYTLLVSTLRYVPR
jgi:hypothetical protein